jgi:hypothetical protein
MDLIELMIFIDSVLTQVNGRFKKLIILKPDQVQDIHIVQLFTIINFTSLVDTMDTIETICTNSVFNKVNGLKLDGIVFGQKVVIEHLQLLWVKECIFLVDTMGLVN